jgi:hypothetical protein
MENSATPAKRQRSKELLRIKTVLREYAKLYQATVTDELVEQVEIALAYAKAARPLATSKEQDGLRERGRARRDKRKKLLSAAKRALEKIQQAAKQLEALQGLPPKFSIGSLGALQVECEKARSVIHTEQELLRRLGKPQSVESWAYLSVFRLLEEATDVKLPYLPSAVLCCELLHPEWRDEERRKPIKNILQALRNDRVTRERKLKK